MIDAKGLLNQLMGSGAASGFAGGLAGGVLGNLVSGKKGRKLAGSALKIGGAAVIGGLAYKAWQNYQRTGSVMPAGAQATPGSDFIPPQGSQAEQNLSLLLAKAMISAAKADGQIDTEESQRILNEINRLQLPAEDKAFLFEAYSSPLDIRQLAAEVRGPEQAAEVYAASVLMLEDPSPPERIYLDTLARELRVDPGLAAEIQATVAANSQADATFAG